MKFDYKKELKNVLDIKRLFWVLLGNVIYCIGIVAFVLPLGLITGGTTGLGLIVEHYLHIPVEAFAAVFNIVMFLVAWFALGATFAFTTMVSSFCFPIILALLHKVEFLQGLTTDPMLATICAGLLIGVGIGMVIRVGASTGGVDIPPLVMHKKLGVPVSVGLYACDFVILIGQMIFRDRERILYGIILVLIYTFIMDKVLVIGKSQMQVQIISEKYEEINEVIQKQLDRGTTFVKSESGYFRKDMLMLMTVVSNRELAKLNQLVSEIDPKAFIIIHEVKEVMGRGFTLHKKAR